MNKKDNKRDGRFGGYILIVLGVFFLLSKFITWLTFDLLWPLILIGFGIHIVSRNTGNDENTSTEKDGENQDEK